MAKSPFEPDNREALQRRVALERTIAAVSRRLLLADQAGLDTAIDETLAQLGRFVGADRAYLFQFHDDGAHVYNSHEWCAEGIDPHKDQLQHLYFEPASLFGRTLLAGQMLDIPSVADMPYEVPEEKALLQMQGIQSTVMVPMPYRSQLLGFVGFDAVRQQRIWSEADHTLLELAVEGLSNALVRRRDEQALQASEHRLRDLFERMPKISVQGYDEQRRVIFWNSASEVLYGYSAQEAIGQTLEDLIIPPSMHDYVVEAHRAWLEEGVEIPASELTLHRKDGSPVQVFSTHLLRPTAEGKIEMYCVDIDLTEQKAAQAGLLLAARVVEHARESIAVINARGQIEAANPALCEVSGYSREQLMGQPIDILQHGTDAAALWAAQWQTLAEQGSWSGECRLMRADGKGLPVLATLSALRDSPQDPLERVVAMYTDISLQKAHEAELHFLATHDVLTGLPNRSLLRDRLGQALLRCQRTGERVAVAYIDLDGFKAINDTHGHATGDELLRHISSQMQGVMRGIDTLARLGGDEFVAVLVDLPSEQAVIPLLTRMLDRVAEPLQWHDRPLQITASVGISFGSGDEPEDADTLLRQADLAMYQAKLSGKNRYAFFDARLDQVVRQQHEKETRFIQALAKDELLLYYQPQVNLRTGEVVGMEALLRWAHPEQGLLLPGQFLPSLERQDVNVALGEWVLRTALNQLRRWIDQGLNWKVNINIAGSHLQHPLFLQQLSATLDAYPDIPRHAVVLELLESSALSSLEDAADVIRACRALGVGVALDDFGTGFSSLAYLKLLPADVLKIDRSFVRDMLHDEGDRAILNGILLLGQAFGRMVVAEGVETEAQGQALIDMGCEVAQGYAIARPMPAEAVQGWAKAWLHASI